MKDVHFVHQADYWHDEKMTKQKVRLALHTCMTLQKEQKKHKKKLEARMCKGESKVCCVNQPSREGRFDETKGWGKTRAFLIIWCT